MHRLVLLLAFSFLAVSCDSSDPDPEPDPTPQNEPPTASFSFSPDAPRAGETVSFTANASDADGQIVSYSWDFDRDGEQDASGTNPTFAFPQRGDFSVSLTVTDDDGAERTARETVPVAQRFTQATIEGVTVVEMPFVDTDGSGWDSGSGPDVYVVAYDPMKAELDRSSEQSNVAPSDLPLLFDDVAFEVDDLGERYALRVFDDDDVSNDEFIGGISFTLQAEIGSYPATVRLDAGAGLVLDIALDWQE